MNKPVKSDAISPEAAVERPQDQKAQTTDGRRDAVEIGKAFIARYPKVMAKLAE